MSIMNQDLPMKFALMSTQGGGETNRARLPSL
jgi:hypothetical protein